MTATPSPASPLTCLPLLRLLQVADSAFPVGGFAYSHGLESLAAHGAIRSESDLADVLRRYIAQPLRRQTLPAAALAHTAARHTRLLAIDGRLDRSFTLPGERDASRAMGRRLLSLALEIEPGLTPWAYRIAVERGEAPGHYPVAFGAFARHVRAPLADALAALAHGVITSLVSAASRLGLIGPAASTRLVAGAAPLAASAVESVTNTAPACFGSWLPHVEIAAALHPKLPFRMFAT